MLIREDDLSGPEIGKLLETHLAYAQQCFPDDSNHTLNLDGLRVPEITFWTVWEAENLLGCGALKEIDSGHGEIKSMHTVEAHRGKGIATLLVKHILDVARQRFYPRISLETGAKDAFSTAHALYARFGFEYCEPFADYKKDVYCDFMTLEL
ncbi:MAG: GNAT family N-acetyltransferase [Rhodospirillales bacterium]